MFRQVRRIGGSLVLTPETQFLQKPFTEATLTREIREALGDGVEISERGEPARSLGLAAPPHNAAYCLRQRGQLPTTWRRLTRAMPIGGRAAKQYPEAGASLIALPRGAIL